MLYIYSSAHLHYIRALEMHCHNNNTFPIYRHLSSPLAGTDLVSWKEPKLLEGTEARWGSIDFDDCMSSPFFMDLAIE